MPRKILLADDSVTAQNMGRKILHDAGYEVVTVNNGSAALKKVAETKPELIVLDVYMPGYSGLEVCQRIKETRETAHIPVLLTVGKLEPFKQDEARRVRADAFIIKPFEATELLAALGKLEDRIVSPPSPAQETKPSGTMAEFERFATQRGPRFGDEESGWKARLTIPSAGPKLTEPDSEIESVSPAAPSFRDLVAEEKPRVSAAPSATAMDRPIPAGIPQDITADEIAAIAAAASRLSGGVSVGKDFERLADKTKETTVGALGQMPAVSQIAQTGVEATATASQAQASAQTASVESPAIREATKEIELKKSEIATSPPIAELASATVVAENQPQSVSQAVPTTAEVDVVLKSISSKDVGTTFASMPAPETVHAAAATIAVGSRWVAEEVPVEATEALLVLESEMHKAHAAFAAAESSSLAKAAPQDTDEKYEPAPVDKEDEPMFATMAPPAIGAPVPVAEIAQSGSTTVDAEKPEPAPTLKDLRHEISKPPAPPFTPPVISEEEESRHAAPALGGPHLSEPEPEPAPALAAAPEPVSSSVIQNREEKPADSATGETHREADLASATAAAWASWKDIREAMTGANRSPRTPDADTSAELAEIEALKALKGLKTETQPSAPPEAAMAAAASADGSSPSAADANLASIVDSMLAELKPKLMAELAEKLKKEKK